MNPLAIRQFLQQALLEDVGIHDVTTELIFDPSATMQGIFLAKADGRIAGLEVVEETFKLMAPSLEFECMVQDGADVTPGTVLASVQGSARAILSAERVALNMVQRMSGIATETRNVCRLIAGSNTQIVDTRKTVPGLRLFDKYAVTVGGGRNHRFGLYDAVLIKDNHIAAAGSLTLAVERVKRGLGHLVKIEVETDTLEQVEEALAAQVDVIMLDNMTPAQVTEAVKLVGGRAVTEASGGITPANVASYGSTGVDAISLGWLTHSVKALDISLDVR
ncbi:carboxylating nicotinate-nucleotide diphosphorylase [Alicyclobacillus fodiniaquatilis]|jgi:nicotinate-nucleotide pyrophosphorylase (carboxylating)|uniref:nicotinate-nucleotide diphosphorylase (carboxylating) n=1 Tax=Alicyclobacillus fodiniaquatilis TaxID=1661150 RepID=A0ABW4JDP1_9BACL